MRWETAVAILLTPLAADLLRRWDNYEKPFDGSWTVARVLSRLKIGKQPDAGVPQIGRQELRALPPPTASEVVSEQSAVDSAPSGGAEASPSSDQRPQ